MFSKDEYKIFQRDVERIILDTFVEETTEEGFKKEKYFFQKGLLAGTEDNIYFYDKEKIKSHKNKLLSLCKQLPKYHQATDVHAGTISSFDLMQNTEVISSQPPEEYLYQRAISNHFANLVCGADIAFVGTVSSEKGTAFLIFLDSKYRSYMESDDQDPFEG